MKNSCHWDDKKKLRFTSNRCPYAAVAELIYGKRMCIFVNIILNVTVFGAGIPNILVGMRYKSLK